MSAYGNRYHIKLAHLCRTVIGSDEPGGMLSVVDGNRPRPRRVFIAHTSELHDLPEKRSFVGAARDAIVAAGDLPVEMALFTASERPPAELCRENVREADVLVLIAGIRYGSPVIDEQRLSLFLPPLRLGLRRWRFLHDLGAAAAVYEVVDADGLDQKVVGSFERREVVD